MAHKNDDPDSLAGECGAENRFPGRQAVFNSTTIREIIAGRRAEDRRRDLRWLEKHLDEGVLIELADLLRELQEPESDLKPAVLVKWIERIERAAGTAIAVLSDVIDDEAAP
jgi:hypothetical protein